LALVFGVLVLFFAAAWGGAARFGAAAWGGAAGLLGIARLGAASGLCGVLSGLAGLFVACLVGAGLRALGAVLLELFALATAFFGLHLLI
jgi:hypothetical protein